MSVLISSIGGEAPYSCKAGMFTSSRKITAFVVPKPLKRSFLLCSSLLIIEFCVCSDEVCAENIKFIGVM